MNTQIRWTGGQMLTTIQGIEGCSVDCSYYPGTPMRHRDDEPDEPEFDIIAAYLPSGVKSDRLLRMIDDVEWERIHDEYIEFWKRNGA